MLNTRNVVAAAVIITVLSFAGGLLSLLQSPGGGLGIDTYGTRDHGFRGIFELLAELHVPVERSNAPPNHLVDRDITLALIEPSPEIVSTEPAYLNAVGKWVRSGGTVVVSPSVRPAQMTGRSKSNKNVLSELGLEGVTVQSIGPKADGHVESDPSRTDRSFSDEAKQTVNNEMSLFGRWPSLSASVVHVTADGTLAAAFPSGLDLMLPNVERRVIESENEPTAAAQKNTPIETANPKRGTRAASSRPKQKPEPQKSNSSTVQGTVPAGRIRAVLEVDGQPDTLAAVYPLGQGKIIVLADARLAQNRFVGQADNPVLVSHLLTDPHKPVVFDEFYHGLTIRANPLWLLSRFPYDILAASVLAATVLAGWHAFRFLGPPLAPRAASRRTLSEYIEAMARLLNRSKSPAPFLLTEIRQGLLWRIRRDLGLPPGPDDVEKIVWILERRDPPLAEKTRQAIRAIDDSLAHPHQSAKELATTLAKVSVCVPRHAV